MTHPLDPGSPFAPPPLQPLLLLSHLQPVEPPHIQTQDQEMEKQRYHSSLSAPHLLSCFPHSSSPVHPPISLMLHPPPPPLHLPFPLNLQTPAALEPWLYSSDEPGREHAKVTRCLLQSSLEIQCCWRAESRSAAWLGSPDSGTEKQVEPLVAWRCLWM